MNELDKHKALSKHISKRRKTNGSSAYFQSFDVYFNRDLSPVYRSFWRQFDTDYHGIHLIDWRIFDINFNKEGLYYRNAQ